LSMGETALVRPLRSRTKPALVASVVGARPNFMKLAPVARELARRQIEHVIVHTGQHYDTEMSEAFFRDCGLAHPAYNLEVGSGSHGQQTGAIMQRLEPVLIDVHPDLVLIYGDVNSTVAAALVAAKLGIRVGHVEAGLRSWDWSMPEEINRVVTDRLSDLLFVPSRDAIENLKTEGTSADRIHFVGNIMIDSLVRSLPTARELDAPGRHGLRERSYIVVTLHRPSNVDCPDTLAQLLNALSILSAETPVLFPLHPRTRERVRAIGFRPAERLRLLAPLSYFEMLGLVASAKLIITDSGGLQEETTYLGVPCLTVRPNTERPVTCSYGTNRLVRPECDAILDAARNGVRHRSGGSIERWDGKTAERIVAVLCDGAHFD
jgi:UDP-N-acetylglucosamine 2-epimerase (non-hydrolysing)